MGGRRGALLMLAMLALAAGIGLLRLLVDRAPDGSIGLSWPHADWASFRLTAVVVGALVGAGLAVAGVLLQTLLRNPLASPYILGISSGAGLGVMIACWLAFVGGWGHLSEAGSAGPAILGGLATLAVVSALGQRRGVLDPVTLILVGVVVSTIAAAGIMFFQHLVPTGVRGEFTTWLMGHIPETTPVTSIIGAAVIIVGGIALTQVMSRAMDVAALSDDEARSVGLPLARLRAAMFVLAGVLTAVTVALAGPIGFVGLIAPHVARLIVGQRHSLLTPTSAAVGIVLVVGSDAVRQLLDLGAGRMPIGVFTALVGGPIFIWLLLSSRGRAC